MSSFISLRYKLSCLFKLKCLISVCLNEAHHMNSAHSFSYKHLGLNEECSFLLYMRISLCDFFIHRKRNQNCVCWMKQKLFSSTRSVISTLVNTFFLLLLVKSNFVHSHLHQCYVLNFVNAVLLHFPSGGLYLYCPFSFTAYFFFSISLSSSLLTVFRQAGR